MFSKYSNIWFVGRKFRKGEPNQASWPSPMPALSSLWPSPGRQWVLNPAPALILSGFAEWWGSNGEFSFWVLHMQIMHSSAELWPSLYSLCNAGQGWWMVWFRIKTASRIKGNVLVPLRTSFLKLVILSVGHDVLYRHVSSMKSWNSSHIKVYSFRLSAKRNVSALHCLSYRLISDHQTLVLAVRSAVLRTAHWRCACWVFAVPIPVTLKLLNWEWIYWFNHFWYLEPFVSHSWQN